MIKNDQQVSPYGIPQIKHPTVLYVDLDSYQFSHR